MEDANEIYSDQAMADSAAVACGGAGFYRLPYGRQMCIRDRLTAEYAQKIGADYYCRDAKESVDTARLVLG